MSSGAQIGGIIGGVIGFFAGGNVQLGYMIGSAIGGYVDPAKNYGPRLEDASSQTSTVGGVVPFGYGVFTTAGNVIWAADLVEHRKSERAGKGGGQKNYTYTYTRSYAVGVCKGPISAYLWVKRNGKLIYAADPQGLGAAMGWTGEQIADLVEASSKFRQIATLYYGTERQMPDSTITAVEGVGNVAPHRGLAYIVLENDDVTDLRGAVGQFEFCVQASLPDVYVTSKPYPVLSEESLGFRNSLLSGTLNSVLKQVYSVDSIGLTTSILNGVCRGPVADSMAGDSIGLQTNILIGSLVEPVQYTDTSTPSIGFETEITGGELRVALMPSRIPTEQLTIESVILSGGLE